MAAESERQTEALIARLAASRRAVGHDLAILRHRLDVPARVKESVMSKPLAWFGGSLGAGLLASFLLKGRKSKPKPEKVVRRSLWSLALGGAFTLARPALQWGQEGDRRKAREAGFDRHMIKPAELDALQDLLASLASP